MNWIPSGLPQQIINLARAIDRRFQPINPENPVRLLVLGGSSELPPPKDWEGALVHLRDAGAGQACPVFSDGAAWRRVDTRGTV